MRTPIELRKLADELGIRQTRSEAGTPIFSLWAKCVEHAAIHEDARMAAEGSRLPIREAGARLCRDAAIAEAHRYWI